MGRAEQAAWLAIAAEEKAATVINLAPTDVRTVVDIGAGSGAVLTELDRKAFAERYWACEPSDLLLEISAGISRLVDTSQTTFNEAFSGVSFDLAILSHVVEHLVTPAVLIAQALERARYVVVEVPIEANVAGNLRRRLKQFRGNASRPHAAGHVQFFSRRRARLLVEYAGGEVISDLGYFPVAPYRAHGARFYHRVVLAGHRIGLARHYYEHYGMLIRRRSTEDWSHDHYYAPA